MPRRVNILFFFIIIVSTITAAHLELLDNAFAGKSPNYHGRELVPGIEDGAIAIERNRIYLRRIRLRAGRVRERGSE